ncbi:MAG: radical SAM protein [Candidatus Omnitrophota bacterium]
MHINNDELKKRIAKARALSARCRLCPRACGRERPKGETGFCGAGRDTKIHSYRQFLGEEPPISGTRGSGVIFFSHCTMKCVYCQNYRFSQEGEGYTIGPDALSGVMLSLKNSGCHNINLVTPTQYLPEILESLLLAKEGGLDIPIVYNTSGYESTEAIGLLDGIVDIYLADMRYSDNALSKKYSAASDYVEANRAAISAMHGQVGELSLEEGVAIKGLIIRHLVMPGLAANTDGALKHIASRISRATHVSLMSQYMPLHRAGEFKEISRRIAPEEYRAACEKMKKYGLHNGWTQNL